MGLQGFELGFESIAQCPKGKTTYILNSTRIQLTYKGETSLLVPVYTTALVGSVVLPSWCRFT